jgi:hypothetical protein
LNFDREPPCEVFDFVFVEIAKPRDQLKERRNVPLDGLARPSAPEIYEGAAEGLPFEFRGEGSLTGQELPSGIDKPVLRRQPCRKRGDSLF